ncbi:MAG: pyridoxamine 5'-phosphate oxidase family protein [Candidatus Nanopelagicales bacterium]
MSPNPSAPDSLPVNERTRVRRLPENSTPDRAAMNAILDEALVAHVGFVDEHGLPVVIPCAHARRADELILHGSQASRMFRTIRSGAPICITVTLLDGLVYARSLFESSMNYRSVTIFGTGELVDADEEFEALLAFSEHVMPGRKHDVRPTLAKELKATMVIRVPLEEASVKIGAGDGEEPTEDLTLPHWAGVLPLRLVAGEPVDSPDLAGGIPVPDYVLQHPLRRGV